MNKTAKLRNNFRQIFTILISGNPSEYKEAKKEIDRLFKSSDIKIFKKAATIALEYLYKLKEIKNLKNKKAFLSGLSLFFLVLSDNYFDKLKDFTLKAIQNPDGHVREAIRKTADWLFISLSARMSPFVYPKGKPLSVQQKEKQKVARKQFQKYLTEVEELMDKYHLKENEKVKYIDQMKPSVEKSLQMLWCRLSDLSKYTVEPEPEILKKREEIERELSNILDKYNVKSSVNEIKESVFEENSHEDLNEIIKLFRNVDTLPELNNILKILNDVWNYFPHKSLGGLSPHEKRLEYLN
jgi:hypothetical protein